LTALGSGDPVALRRKYRRLRLFVLTLAYGRAVGLLRPKSSVKTWAQLYEETLRSRFFAVCREFWD